MLNQDAESAKTPYGALDTGSVSEGPVSQKRIAADVVPTDPGNRGQTAYLKFRQARKDGLKMLSVLVENSLYAVAHMLRSNDLLLTGCVPDRLAYVLNITRHIRDSSKDKVGRWC